MSTVFDLVGTACSKVGFLSAEEEIELLKKAKNGSEKAKNDLFCANSRFLLKEAGIYADRFKLDLDDIFGACCEGFLKAIDKYDFSKGTRLITLARWWILNCVQEEAYRSHFIRLPYNKISQLKASIFQDSEVDLNTIYASGSPVSLDAPVLQDSSKNLGDILCDDKANPEDYSDYKNCQDVINRTMEKVLTNKELKVIRMNFGFDDGEEKSLSEIGVVLGCSKQCVGQIKQNALKKLRKPDVGVYLRDFAA